MNKKNSPPSDEAILTAEKFVESVQAAAETAFETAFRAAEARPDTRAASEPDPDWLRGFRRGVLAEKPADSQPPTHEHGEPAFTHE